MSATSVEFSNSTRGDGLTDTVVTPSRGTAWLFFGLGWAVALLVGFEVLGWIRNPTPLGITTLIRLLLEAFLAGALLSTYFGLLADRKRELATKSAAEQIRLQVGALQAAANGIVITDATGKIVWANRAFTALTGYTLEECVGKNPRILKSWDYDESFYKALWFTIQSGEVWHGEIRNRKKNGSLYTEEMTITPVRSAGGEITHFIAIKQDVTEKKKLEAQYQQAQKMEVVGRLAGGIAHDFNNILNVITGYAEISLDDLDPTSPIGKNLMKINASARRAASLTRQLLAFSRQQIMSPQVVDLNQIVNEMLEMLRRLVGDDIAIVLKTMTPVACIKADVGQLEQVLMNLAVNARDAMPDGGEIVVETSEVEIDAIYQKQDGSVPAGSYVVLSVADSGCGMDETTRARIFEPFFTTKAVGKGTGLGLSTVYGIVKQNAGSIWVYSEPGQGTIIKILLPKMEASQREAVASGHAIAEFHQGSGSILLVEDDEALRELLKKTLETAGYHVLDTGRPQRAIELLACHRNEVRLLLTDVVMSSMSGVQLFELLQSSMPDLKVVFMSGYAPELLARRGKFPTSPAFIEKPFSKRMLLSSLHNALQG